MKRIDKKTKSLLIVLSIIAVVLIVGASLMGYKWKLTQQEYYPSSNCVLITNPLDSTSPFSNTITGNSFTCTSTECIVSGKIVLSAGNISTASFNLCPSSAPGFTYCTGNSNVVTGTGEKFTDNYKMLKNETLTFLPQYNTNTAVAEHYLYIKNYNCSSSISGARIILSAKESYAMNENVKDVQVELTNAYSTDSSEKSNVRVEFKLLNKDTLSQRGSTVITTTSSNGKAIVDCNTVQNCFGYIPTAKENLIIRALVGPEGTAELVEKEVSILPGLNLILNCPTQGTAKREVECIWMVKDKSSGADTSATPALQILQGGVAVEYTTIGTTKVHFTPQATGTVDVYVTASKPDYVSDKKYAQVSIQGLSIDVVFYIDNKNILSFPNIASGLHTIKIRAEESGLDKDVQAINAIIKTPSGQTVPLTFVKNADGWKVDYDFQQEGYTYQLTGDLTFVDSNTAKQAISYNIVTVATAATQDKTTITYTIIGTSIAILVSIIVLVFILRRKK